MPHLKAESAVSLARDRMNEGEGMNPLRFSATSLPAGLKPARMFELMKFAFDSALTAGTALAAERGCVLAGQPARLRIIGRRLAGQILPALDHLVQEDSGPRARLKIDLWDESETAIACPIRFIDEREPDSPEWRKRQYGITIGSPAERFIGRRRFHMFMCIDRWSQHIIGWAQEAAEFSALERANPVRFPLFLWHSDQGAEVIHAGLVARNGFGILLGGKGGAGKTTTALACLFSGFDYLGDDYVGLQASDDGSFVGHSLYSSAWLAKNNLHRFPGLVAHAEPDEYGGSERFLVFLHTLFSGQLASNARIRVLVLPRVAGGLFCGLRPATKGEALLALAPTSIVNLPNSGPRALQKFASLVESIPCYWLELGAKLETVPRCLEELIS